MEKASKTLSMAKTYHVSYQTELLPIDALQIHCNNQGSADLQVIVTGSNNKDYAVKTIQDGRGFVPATELFCYELAKLINIPTPNYDLITMRDGSFAFGSTWEGGVSPIKDINQVIAILTGKTIIRDLNLFLSRVYAFDLFINNIDRHFGNYLFRESFNSMIGLAFDYSRAWYEVGAFSFDSLNDKETKTQQCHSFIKDYNKYDRLEASKTLDKILSIEAKSIEAILQKIPDDWLETQAKNEVAHWWASDSMELRISTLKRGI
jgi:hypothetical protein